MAVSDGIVLDFTPHQEHVLTLVAFAGDVDAPMRSLAATVAAGGEITTCTPWTSPPTVRARPGPRRR
jgi:hypothetical protein